MITVNINYDGYTVEGHAEKEMVCTAVSAITQTTYLGLKDCVEVHLENDDGYFNVKLYNYSDKVEILLKAMRMGLEHIRDIYPNQLEIVEVKHGQS